MDLKISSVLKFMYSMEFKYVEHSGFEVVIIHCCFHSEPAIFPELQNSQALVMNEVRTVSQIVTTMCLSDCKN
jgi:hypothetical protein